MGAYSNSSYSAEEIDDAEQHHINPMGPLASGYWEAGERPIVGWWCERCEFLVPPDRQLHVGPMPGGGVTEPHLAQVRYGADIRPAEPSSA